MEITFLLNGETVSDDVPTTQTLLDWLRETRGLKGTKEGCNEGDCGACTVILTDEKGTRPVNACILFLPQLHGKAVRTVEGVAGPEGMLHPVQEAMIAHHGSQCGFCTPGFITSMAAAHMAGERDHRGALAGNLCRCTGYAPILRAAEAASAVVVPPWMHDMPPDVLEHSAIPQTSDDLAAVLKERPKALIVGGGTDVGLWVTKGMQDLDDLVFLHRCRDLQHITCAETEIHIGAAVTMDRVLAALDPLLPSYAAMIRRYGSPQVRAAATIGGNIANGSPIGDNPPALIALGATLVLRCGAARRVIPVEDFFITYGQQDLRPGEFIAEICIPLPAPDLRVYKLSKRQDQDISALCGAFNITVQDGLVTRARIAFGGMAGTPKRAHAVETALIGQPWTEAKVQNATAKFSEDYTPLSDHRAGAAYRLETARNMLLRVFHERQGKQTAIGEVRT